MRGVLPVLLILLLGCSDTGLREAPPPLWYGETDTWFLEREDYADIVLVVDNSGSMGDEQDELSSSFEAFVEFIERAETHYHIGVVTTDVDAEFAENNLVDPQKAKVNLTFESVPLQAMAKVDMQALSGGSAAKGGEITVDCDIAELMARIETFLPKGLNAAGTIKTVLGITGTTEKPNVQGSTVLSQIAVTLPPSGEGAEKAAPISLGPLALTVHHDAEYDTVKQAAKIARLANNANVIVLSIRLTGEMLAKEIVDTWLSTVPSTEPRRVNFHKKTDEIDNYYRSGHDARA